MGAGGVFESSSLSVELRNLENFVLLFCAKKNGMNNAMQWRHEVSAYPYLVGVFVYAPLWTISWGGMVGMLVSLIPEDLY